MSRFGLKTMKIRHSLVALLSVFALGSVVSVDAVAAVQRASAKKVAAPAKSVAKAGKPAKGGKLAAAAPARSGGKVVAQRDRGHARFHAAAPVAQRAAFAPAVSEIDQEKRKITLAPIGEAKEHDDWKHFVKKEKAAAPQGGGLNLLGDKLQEALAKKKH